MTALEKLIHQEREARTFGFDWPDKIMIIEQAMSECREIQEVCDQHGPPERLQEEIGDLLHAAVSLCLFAGFDVEETLEKVTRKFGTRMEAMRALTHQRGLKNLQGQSIEFMLELWREAKWYEK